ncbi:MAG: FliM/FliN family flagellar motor switch protein [Pseudomonadota bacterium]
MTQETTADAPEHELDAAPLEAGATEGAMDGVVDGAMSDDMDDAPELNRRDNSSHGRHRRAIFSVPVQVVISVGKTEPSIGELLNMKRDTLLPLDTKIDDPVDIMVGKRVIARGELQEMEDTEGRLGVRLTEIVDLSEPF